MKNQNDYLYREATYQDKKIENNPRIKLGKYYSDAASKYRLDFRDKLIGNLSQKHVLDLGCGEGSASLQALRAGGFVTAVDISPKSIEFLVSRAREENLADRLIASVMDAHHLEIEDNTFDVVFGNGILHHLVDLNLALGEIKRVLKPSGYAVFLEPLGMNPFINMFRKITPGYRTVDEQPFRISELNLCKEYFPDAEFVFFDCATLIAKLPLRLGLHKLAEAISKTLISIDDALLRRKKKTRVTFIQKMSWIVVIYLKK